MIIAIGPDQMSERIHNIRRIIKDQPVFLILFSGLVKYHRRNGPPTKIEWRLDQVLVAATVPEDVQNSGATKKFIFRLGVAWHLQWIVELKIVNEHPCARQATKIDFFRRTPAIVDVVDLE